MRQKRRTPRRRAAPRWTAADWEDANLLLLTRCGYRCERCGEPITDTLERHHRQRRTTVGDRLANLLLLHPRCHAYITEHPDEARANGWIVSSYAPDPAAEPVRIDGIWWLLRDDGGKSPKP